MRLCPHVNGGEFMSASEPQRGSPYQGLIPYDEADAPFFFGREKEARLIIANLFASPLTLLYGASGVGKSSVLRAGVARQLRAREELLIVVFNAWQSNPLVDLKNKIAAAAAPLNVSLETSDSIHLSDYLANCATQLNRRLMIILDQFEEYFLYHPQEDQFAPEFARAVTRSGAPVSFLISIREDFYAKLDRFEGRIPTLYDNYLRIEHLDRQAARGAIEKPIDQYNRQFTTNGQFSIEPQLVDAVLRQVETGRVIIGEAGRGVVEASTEKGTARIETPFLQLVMTRLWEKESGEGSHKLRLQTLKELGGAENIVRTHLDAVITRLSARDQEIAASMFHYLVTPSGTKIAYTASDLAGSAELQKPEVERVLDNLAHGDVRILRTVEPSPDRPGAPRYEIFHDVLAPAILSWRTAHVQKQEKAETERQLAAEAEERARAERQLARERSLARRLRWALVGLAILLLVMGGVTVFAFTQRSTARKATAQAQELQREAERQRGVAAEQRTLAIAEKNRAEQALSHTKLAQAQEKIQKDRAEQALITVKGAQAQLVEQRNKAVKATADALTQKEIAENALAEAQQARDDFETAAREAGRQKNRAEFALKEATRAKEEAEDQKSIAQSRELAAAGVSQLSIDPELGVLLAIEAARLKPTTEATDALRQALLASHIRMVVKGHSARVNGVAFSPNGKNLATASWDRSVLISEADTGQKLATLTGHKGLLMVVAYSPDGQSILTVDRSNSARVWDAKTYQQLTELIGYQSPVVNAEDDPDTYATFSPDNRLIVLPNGDNTVRVWETRTGKQVVELRGHTSIVWSAGFSPDGASIVTASSDQTVRVWESSTGRQLKMLAKHSHNVVDARFSHDGKRVLTASSDKTAILWEPATDAVVSLNHADRIYHVAFSPDDKLMATASLDNTARLWTFSGEQLAQLNHTGHVNEVTFSPDGQFVLTASDDRSARLWKTSTGEEVAVLRGHTDKVLRAAFSPDGQTIVTSSMDETARLWRIRTIRSLLEFAGGRATYSPDGKLVATVDTPTSVRIWDAATGRTISQLSGHQTEIQAVKFSPDAKLIGTSDRSTVRVWDPYSGKQLATMPGQALFKIAFSPDSKLLLSTLDFKLQIREAATGKQLAELPTAFHPIFTHDSKSIIADARNEIRIWDIQSMQSRLIFKREGTLRNVSLTPDDQLLVTMFVPGSGAGVTNTIVVNISTGEETPGRPGQTAKIDAFSPDGRFALSGEGDRVERVWEVRTGATIAELLGHSGNITDAKFSPDGKFVVTASDDNTARVWEVSTGHMVAEFHGHANSVRTAQFGPDSRRILTADRAAGHLFECEVCDSLPALMGLASAHVTRTLTADEREKYLHERER
jgi:WD40 repeat protein